MKKKSNKIEKKSMSYNVLFSTLLGVGVAIILGIGYYYADMNKFIKVELLASGTYFYSFFLAITVGIFMAVLATENKTTIIKIGMFLIPSAIAIVFALVQPMFFLRVSNLFLIAKTLGGIGVFIATSVIVYYLVRKLIERLTYFGKKQLIMRDELNAIAIIFFAYTALMAVLPFILLQENSFFERVFLCVVLGIGAALFSLIHYTSIKKRLYVADSYVVEQYRYNTLRLHVLPKEQQVLEAKISKHQKEIELKENFIAQKENERKTFEELETNRPVLEEENAELLKKLSAYDIMAIEQRKKVTESQIRKRTTEIWEEHFAKEHDEKSQAIEIAEERLASNHQELTTITTELENEIDKYETMQSELTNLVEEQEDRKMLRAKVSELIHNLQSQLETEGDALDDKEIKSIQTKIEKNQRKEATYDAEIGATQQTIATNQEAVDKVLEKIQNLEETQLPDLQYVIQTTEENLTESKESLKELERAFDKEKESDEILKESIELVLSLERQMDAVATLQKEQQAVADKLATDGTKGMQDAEEAIAEATNAIADINKKIAELENEKGAFLEKISETTEALNSVTK